MAQLNARGNPDIPHAITTDGNDSYLEEMLETWGKYLSTQAEGGLLPRRSHSFIRSAFR